MNSITHHHIIKVVFGLAIFLFGLALAYFTADYVANNTGADRWISHIFFIAVYLVVGMVVMNIYSISLGFLFASDVLLLDVLGSNFYRLDDWVKALIVGVILALLYAIALRRFSNSAAQPAQPPPPPVPPVVVQAP